MTARYRGRHHARSLRGPLLVLLGLLAVAGIALPGAYGGYLARVTNNANSAATNPYFTCTAAQGGTTPQAYFTYPFSDATTTLGAADISGNLLRNGGYNGGSSVGQTNTGTGAVCPRDKRTVLTLNGTTGFVSGPTAQMTGPNVFSVEIWFKTSATQGAQGGRLIGFGNQNGTTISSNYDRHLYIDSTGKLVFGVYPGSVQTLSSAGSVTDNTWHHAVGTLSGAGMYLYLDGKQVGMNTGVTTAQSFSGYWRIGWDSLANWVNVPSSNYFNGSLAFASVYTTALSADVVAQHYAAGR